MTEYGDLNHVRMLLRPTQGDDLGPDVDARLTRIQAAVSALLDHELGRTFGVPSAATSVTVLAGPSNLLILPMPARSITSVTVGGTVAGGTVTGGTDYPLNNWAYHFVYPDTALIGGLRLLSGGWWGQPGWTTPVVVTGDFSNADDDGIIPPDLQYAVSWVIAERFKQESAASSGFSGPYGESQPISKLLEDELVKPILARYRVATHALVL